MKNIEIGVQKALELLTEAVHNKGEDYIDQQADAGDDCSYFKQRMVKDDGDRYYAAELDSNGKYMPGCIIGHVVYSLGADLSLMGVGDVEYVTGGTRGALYEDRALRILVSESGLQVLTAAQRLQDKGGRWGAALDAAYKAAGRTRSGASNG